jgi:hypothetical protein
MKLKLHNILIILGFTLWFAETAYFGFNFKAQSSLERGLDYFSIYFTLTGLFLAWCDKPTIHNIKINFDKEFLRKLKEALKDET